MSLLHLKNIRAYNEAELHAAVREVIKLQCKLTLGEMHAITRTIYDRAKEIGASIDRLNQIARGEK